MKLGVNEIFRWLCIFIPFIVVSYTADLGWGIAVSALISLFFIGRDYLMFARWAESPLAASPRQTGFLAQPHRNLYRSLHNYRGRSLRLAQGLRLLRRRAGGLPDGWVIVGTRGEIQGFNNASQILLGLRKNDRGKSLASLIRDPAAADLVAGRVESETIEIPSPSQDGRRLEIRRIVEENEHTIFLARDVTELNRLLSMRQDFVANVSHELRTPLTVILGYAESVDANMTQEEVLTILKRMDGPAKRMKSLVEDLLTLTRLESSPLPAADMVKSYDGGLYLESAIQDARQLSGGKHEFALEAEHGLVIEGVPPELDSALSNLISNAVRYSPHGGRITARWKATETGVLLEVEDHGVGIAPEHISRITERFYRVDFASERIRGGTGLGLAIVKHVLRRHRTQLKVTSELGEGSLFSCEFPCDLTNETLAKAK